MDILELVSGATKESKSFENHPAKELELEERLLYLNGLALVMNVDNEINDEKKEYLRILLKAFEMSEELLNDFVRFAGAPDKETVQSFFKTFRHRDIAKLFLFDALIMTRRDEEVSERETALIDKMCEELEIPKGGYAEIYDLFCHIKNRDWEETRSFSSLSPISVEYFRHLFDYYEVSLEEVLENKAEVLQKELGFEWVEVRYEHGDTLEEIEKEMQEEGGLGSWYWPFFRHYHAAGESAATPQARKYLIAGPVIYAQFIRFLQFAMDNREIRVLDRRVMNKKGEFFADLEMANIEYDQENRIFECRDDLKEKPVSGFTPLGATAFAESVNCCLGYGKNIYFFPDDDDDDANNNECLCFPLADDDNVLNYELIHTYKDIYYMNGNASLPTIEFERGFLRLLSDGESYPDVCIDFEHSEAFSPAKIINKVSPIKKAVFRVMKSKAVS